MCRYRQGQGWIVFRGRGRLLLNHMLVDHLKSIHISWKDGFHIFQGLVSCGRYMLNLQSLQLVFALRLMHICEEILGKRSYRLSTPFNLLI